MRSGADRKQVRVEYNALIQQLTGEDWTDVTLTLSTASPALERRGAGARAVPRHARPRTPVSSAPNAPAAGSRQRRRRRANCLRPRPIEGPGARAAAGLNTQRVEFANAANNAVHVRRAESLQLEPERRRLHGRSNWKSTATRRRSACCAARRPTSERAEPELRAARRREPGQPHRPADGADHADRHGRAISTTWPCRCSRRSCTARRS